MKKWITNHKIKVDDAVVLQNSSVVVVLETEGTVGLIFPEFPIGEGMVGALRHHKHDLYLLNARDFGENEPYCMQKLLNARTIPP